MRIQTLTPVYALLGLIFGGYFALWQSELLASGFQFSELASLVAAQTVLSLMIDIPSGVFADRLGHKRVTLLGFAAYLVAFTLPILGTHRWLFASSILLVGVANAFVSGALDSWATELQTAKEGEIRSRPFILRDQAQRFGMIAGSLAVPIMAQTIFGSSGSAWFIFSAFSLALLIVASRTIAPAPTSRHSSVSEKFQLNTFFKLSAGTPLVWLLVGVFLFGMSDGVVATAFWPTVRELGISDAAALGLIQASLSVSRLLGLELWKRLRWIEEPAVPGVCVLVSGIGFLGFAFADNPVIALTIWMSRIMVLSAYFATIQALIVRMVGSSAIRATALSVASVAAALGAAVSASLVGYLAAADLGGVRAASLLGAAFTISSGLVLLAAVLAPSRQVTQS